MNIRDSLLLYIEDLFASAIARSMLVLWRHLRLSDLQFPNPYLWLEATRLPYPWLRPYPLKVDRKLRCRRITAQYLPLAHIQEGTSTWVTAKRPKSHRQWRIPPPLQQSPKLLPARPHSMKKRQIYIISLQMTQ